MRSHATKETVVEIGPGRARLPRRSARLRAPACHRTRPRPGGRLRRQYDGARASQFTKPTPSQFDFRELGDKLRIVGNLPYNISTPLLFHLLEYRDRIIDMHFMLQKEVVDRMAAAPGSKAYGRLGIMLGCHFDIEALFDVDRLGVRSAAGCYVGSRAADPLPPGTYDIQDEAMLSRLVATRLASGARPFEMP